MTRNVLIALLLLALATIVMILSRDSEVTLNFVFTSVRAWASLVYLSFITLGVIVGVLLK
jgi:hypothetical protein